MKPTEEELKKIKIDAYLCGLCGEVDKYVYLRKDEQGYYIEYAFQEGAPHDNRCLSWYDSYQENAYIRNGWVKDLSEEDKKKRLDTLKKKIDIKVGQLFMLTSYTCGFEEHLESRLEESKKSWENYHPDEPFIPEDHICKVGNPAKKCKNTHCKYWTYEEPVKCACWVLDEPVIPSMVMIPIDLAIKLYNEGQI